jgi:hypothetical protein
MLLVAVYEAGDPASEAMWRDVWSAPKIARHAKLDVVPLMVCFVAAEREGVARPSCLPDELATVRRRALSTK